MRAATFVALAVGIFLLAGSIGLGARERSQHRLAIDNALQTKANEEARSLEGYFERARSIMLLTANNPAFAEFYRSPGPRTAKIRAHGLAIRQAENALAYLERLYRGSIGEACFIDRSGPENARFVYGKRAGFADLSPDESGNPFFRPTFALQPGQVYQARPYVSPDTREWVISNSTPLPTRHGLSPAIVHFEVRLESFRRQAASLADHFEIAIVDGSTGRVVVDSKHPQRRGAALGLPSERRFAFVRYRALAAGLGTFGSHRGAFQRLRRSTTNANDWYVVAVNPAGAGAFAGLGAAPVGMGLAAVALLLFSGIGFRSSRRALQAAAETDALTGLGNRRRLMLDLARVCDRVGRGARFALVLFDLDGFKAYNDTFGHVPGDALLTRLGRKLSAAAGAGSRAYRLGGDEFCLLAPLDRAGDEEQLAAVGAAALSERGEGFSIGASYGCVLLPADTTEPSAALSTADLRMYAKKQGKRASAARQATDALVRALQERSPLLGPHSVDVSDLACAVGEAMGLPEERMVVLRQAAELHDVGKVAIPDAVLDKVGPLTKEEWALIREHTVIGQRIMSAAPALREASRIVRSTHERIDGGGYPDRLSGDEIPLEARIIAVADAYSSMCSERPYRATLSAKGARDELREHAGRQFDATVVDVLLAVLAEEAEPSRLGIRSAAR